LFTDVHTRTHANDTTGGQPELVHSVTPSRSHAVHIVIPMVRQPNFNVLMSMVTWSKVWVRSFMRRWIFSTAWMTVV